MTLIFEALAGGEAITAALIIVSFSPLGNIEEFLSRAPFSAIVQVQMRTQSAFCLLSMATITSFVSIN